MKAYWSDGRGRYGTKDSYDNFPRFRCITDYELFTSSDGLWTYWVRENGIELLRYNGCDIHISVPAVVDGRKVTSLYWTFDGFVELKSGEIPDGVLSIEGAFYGCEGLEDVRLPEGLENISHAFESCFALKNVQVPDSVKDYTYAFAETAIERFTFPQGAQVINNAFSACLSLKHVTIPKTVCRTFEVFNDCEVLEHVELEDGIQRLEDYMFFNCYSLKELKIPESVKEIGRQAVGIQEVLECCDEGNVPVKSYWVAGYEVVPSFHIIGVPGSAAEQYAKEEGIPFIEQSKEV